jgi:hypothetical protein
MEQSKALLQRSDQGCCKMANEPAEPAECARISEETSIHAATLYLWRKG